MKVAVLARRKVEWPGHVHRRWPHVPIVRKTPYWRRAERFRFEHWVAAAILLLAYANAAWLLASE